jgi:hypothetical protein
MSPTRHDHGAEGGDNARPEGEEGGGGEEMHKEGPGYDGKKDKGIDQSGRRIWTWRSRRFKNSHFRSG